MTRRCSIFLNAVTFKKSRQERRLTNDLLISFACGACLTDIYKSGAGSVGDRADSRTPMSSSTGPQELHF